MKKNDKTHKELLINYPLSVIHYPLSIIRYPLSVIHYPLSIIRYQLSINFSSTNSQIICPTNMCIS